MVKSGFRFSKEETMHWVMCGLSLATMILAIMIFIKVNKPKEQ
jgi:hypothetical protein